MAVVKLLLLTVGQCGSYKAPQDNQRSG